MNCNEYKEAISANPAMTAGDEHVEACADCRKYRDEMQALDRNIAAALDISVPELTMPELPDIDVEKVVSLESRRKLSKPMWFAMAASVALAAFIGFRISDVDTSYGTLEEQVLAHMDHEPAALKVTSTAVDADRVARVTAASVATMDSNIGLISYAQSCSINGRDVPHLVVQGEHGPITILLMPHEMVNAVRSLSGESIQGVILPVGDGSIAIIGEKEESLEAVKQKMVNSVTWST
ncbi:MAG: DUF3379 domain-containing protein [Gammaproteobacteria bacterium]|nr:DUF3379 domain-containing protein [Gammaproteobacteria bacterium]